MTAAYDGGPDYSAVGWVLLITGWLVIAIGGLWAERWFEARKPTNERSEPADTTPTEPRIKVGSTS